VNQARTATGPNNRKTARKPADDGGRRSSEASVHTTDEPLSGGRTETLRYHRQADGLISGEGVTTMITSRTAGSVPQQLSRQLDGTRTGRRYQRLLQAHAGQLDFLLTVHPDVREHVDAAREQLQAAFGAGAMDAEAVAAASRVLDDLARYGDVSMQRLVGQLREELECSLGRSLDQVLADH
jgi:hypothetical protein